MNRVFEIEWKETRSGLAKLFVVLVTVFWGIAFSISAVKNGFDYDLIFKFYDPLDITLFYLAACCCSLLVSHLISLMLKVNKVTINSGIISGRNYFGFKSKFPLNSITSVAPFSHNGLNGTIASSELGSIFILEKTKGYDELISLIQEYANQQNA